MKLFVLLLGTCLLAQTPAPQPSFDVIAIHRSDPNATNGFIKPIPGNHGYTAVNVPVRLMIALMYKIPRRQVEGGPDWLDTERFDVEARADAPRSIDDLHTMYQNLLVDRFGLRYHHDVREGNVYALTIDPPASNSNPTPRRKTTRFPSTAAPPAPQVSAFR